MSKWPLVALEEVAGPDRYSVVGGPFGSALGRKDYVNDGVPVIRGAQLGGPGWFSHEDLVYVSEDKADRHLGNLAYPGDVLVTQRGTVGQVGLIPVDAPFERYLLSQSQMKLTVDQSRANARFVYYWLRSPEAQQAMVSSTISAGVPHINLATFKGLKIPLPSLTEQASIADVLGSIDLLLQNKQRRVEVLEEMARAIYREWFVRFRYPGHEDVPLIDSPLGPIPGGWGIRAVGDLASLDKGLSYKGAHLAESGTPMANLKCFRPGGGFRRDGAKPYNGPFKPRHQVSPGDLVMANTDLTQAGTVIGSPAFVPRAGFESGGIASHHLFIVRPSDGVATHWLYESFRDDRFRGYARGVASGTTVLGLRPLDLAAYRIPVPPPELAQRFNEIARGLADMREELAELAEVLASQRDLLLPKLVTGQIDVSHLDLDALTEVATA